MPDGLILSESTFEARRRVVYAADRLEEGPPVMTDALSVRSVGLRG